MAVSPGFCDVQDVNDKNPQRLYDATSKPTIDTVGRLILKYGAIVRGVLNTHGILESSLSDDAKEILKQLNALGAAWEAESGGLAGRSPRLSDHAQQLKDEYDALLEELKDNPSMLETAADAAHVNSRATDITPKDAGEDKRDEPWGPRFTMEEDF
jgi:hypothetical protein